MYIMPTISKSFFSCIALLIVGYGLVTSKKKPLFAKDMKVENEKNNTLFVFVGEKITVKPIPYKQGAFDNGIIGEYKILESIYGEYPRDVIEFKAYNHYEVPPFSNFKNALIFVSESEGQYYEEKYMSTELFKTTDGRWAGGYADFDYNHEFNKNTSIKPVKINFAEEVSYPINITEPDGTKLVRYCPSPYYRIEGDKAIVVYGNYVEDLFKLKRDGVLTARELFGDKKLVIKDLELKEVTDPATKRRKTK